MTTSTYYPVFLVSDHTGITVEKLARSLLSQFSGLEFDIQALPFVDNPEAVARAVARIDAAAAEGVQPLVFATLIEGELRERLHTCKGQVFDIYQTLLQPVSDALHTPVTPRLGQTHGQINHNSYLDRIGALEYAMATDDGVAVKHYEEAEVILVGLSRSGKTPTSLYLALQYGVRAANDPLTEEDLDTPVIPDRLQPFRDKLIGLRISPERLHQIRSKRRPDSRYASMSQCHYEVRQFNRLLEREKIPVLESSQMSIEELAANVIRIKRSVLDAAT